MTDIDPFNILLRLIGDSGVPTVDGSRSKGRRRVRSTIFCSAWRYTSQICWRAKIVRQQPASRSLSVHMPVALNHHSCARDGRASATSAVGRRPHSWPVLVGESEMAVLIELLDCISTQHSPNHSARRLRLAARQRRSDATKQSLQGFYRLRVGDSRRGRLFMRDLVGTVSQTPSPQLRDTATT